MDSNNPKQLNPNVSVDCVIFGFSFDKLKVLLIEREGDFVDMAARLALPGDLIFNHEDLHMAANRVLEELTGLKDIYLKQIGAFGEPNRISKKTDQDWLRSIRADPGARVITIAYYSLVNVEDLNPSPSSFAKAVNWYPVDEIQDLAFDHYRILTEAVKQLRSELQQRPIGFNLMGEYFTISQLQKMYEAILNKPLDKRNFRRKIKKLDILSATDLKEKNVVNKPARFYKFNEAIYNALIENGFDNFGF